MSLPIALNSTARSDTPAPQFHPPPPTKPQMYCKDADMPAVARTSNMVRTDTDCQANPVRSIRPAPDPSSSPTHPHTTPQQIERGPGLGAVRLLGQDRHAHAQHHGVPPLLRGRGRLRQHGRALRRRGDPARQVVRQVAFVLTCLACVHGDPTPGSGRHCAPHTHTHTYH